MRDPAHSPASYEDIKRLPRHLTGQLIRGALYTSPRPAAPHSRLSSALGGELFNPFQRGRGGPGGWWILDEPELHLAEDVLVPDLAGWRVERMPAIPNVPFLTLAPDWVCEVLSPSTASIDRVLKYRLYAAAGVQWLWYIDPIGRTLDAHALKDCRWTELGAWGPGEKPRVAPFDAVELELDVLWGAPDEK